MIKKNVSVAAILLFGKNPQNFFPRAFIRFIRYDGTEAKVGKDMNVIKDVIFEGRILDKVEKAVDFIKIQMKEKTYLGHDGIFVTEEEYSEFVRTEIVVNAAAHRDYGIKGNVKEYGEGVDRMCRELEAIGLPDPVFNNSTFIPKTTVMSADRDQRITGNARIEPENARIGDKKARIGAENARIETSNPWIDAKNAWIEHIKSLRAKGMMTAITSSAIISVLEDLRENQVIGTQDVQKILDCKETKALRIITEMKKAEIIVTVTGQGKDRYILNVS